MTEKRLGEQSTDLVVKKQKIQSGALVPSHVRENLPENLERTSSLLAPTMVLVGHQSEIFTCAFNPTGTVLATAGMDRVVLLWHVSDQFETFAILRGHKNAIMQLDWAAQGERLVTCSADGSVRAWDPEVGAQVKRMNEHDGHVNACAASRSGPPLVASVGNDGNTKVWDLRYKRSIATFPHPYPLTSVTFSASSDAVYSAGIDNTIRAWDLRRGDVALTLCGHTNTVTGLSTSPEGAHLLSNAADNTLRIWDLRPYAPANRCMKVLHGHAHTYERNLLRCAWSADGARVVAGSGDKFVYVWDVGSRKVVYKLPGHNGSVNDVVFHPREPVIASGGSDQQVFLGELVD